MGQWYDKNGSPVYDFPNKSKPGEVRPATLADAKRHGLLPGFTEVAKVLKKDAVDRWKLSMVALAAATTEIRPGESPDQFAERIVDEAMETSRAAADLGVRVHSIIEQMVSGIAVDADEEAVIIAAPYAQWHSDHIDSEILEQSFAHPIGYGGRVDMICVYDGDPAVVDWKTQRGKPGKKMVAYDTYGMQLAAYAFGTGRPESRLINVMIDTNPDTGPRLEIIEHTDDYERYLELFMHCLGAWKILKDYDPSFGE